MNQIKIAQAPLYTSPNPMTFICSKKANGKTNMATLAFWTYASTNPGKVVFSLNKGAYTLELLAKNNEVVIAVPGAELAGALIACGTSSGRDTDKVEKFNIAMQKLDGTEICVPELTRLAIVAKVNSTVDADDHILHICDVTTVTYFYGQFFYIAIMQKYLAFRIEAESCFFPPFYLNKR